MRTINLNCSTTLSYSKQMYNYSVISTGIVLIIIRNMELMNTGNYNQKTDVNFAALQGVK